MIETIPAGHLPSLMEIPRAEAEGQMKLGVEQLGRVCSLAQIPANLLGLTTHMPSWVSVKQGHTELFESEQDPAKPRFSAACSSLFDSLAQTFLHSCPLMTDITVLSSSATDRREEERVSGTSVWKNPSLPHPVLDWTL